MVQMFVEQVAQIRSPRINTDNSQDLLAMHIRLGEESRRTLDKTTFFTSEKEPMQIGYIRRDGGETVPAHYHTFVGRKIFGTPETLIVLSGRMRVNIYDHANGTEERALVESLIAVKGDILYLISGHSIEFLEATELFEVKQGPYAGERDKVYFNPTTTVSEGGIIRVTGTVKTEGVRTTLEKFGQ